MKPEEFKDKCRDLAVEFNELHQQMLVNFNGAEKYKSALSEIASLLGWVQDNNPSCIGPPPDDSDEIALRLVRERWSGEPVTKCPVTQSTLTTPLKPRRDKPVLSIGRGLLLIEDCGCNQVVLDIESAKELHRLLPGLISILEPLCSGNGSFMFGHIP